MIIAYTRIYFISAIKFCYARILDIGNVIKGYRPTLLSLRSTLPLKKNVALEHFGRIITKLKH